MFQKEMGNCKEQMPTCLLGEEVSPNDVLADLHPAALDYIHMFSLSSLTLAVNITYLNAYPLGNLTKHLNSLTSY